PASRAGGEAESGNGSRLVGGRAGAGVAPPDGWVVASDGAEAGVGERRLLGRTPQAAPATSRTRNAAPLEADPELRTDGLCNRGAGNVGEVAVGQTVEREEDPVRELSIEAIVGLVADPGVDLEPELGGVPVGRARGLERLRVDERAEDAERIVEGVAHARLEVERVGDAADDLPPEDEVDPVVLIEAEVADVPGAERRLVGGVTHAAGPRAVLGTVVVAPLRARGGNPGRLGARTVGLVSEPRSRVTARRTHLQTELQRAVEQSPLGLQRAAVLGD